MTKKDDKYRIDRRTFVKLMGTAVGAIALSRYLPDLIPSASASIQVTQTPLLGKAIPKYMTPLPTFGPTAPSLPRVDGTVPLTVTMKEFQQKVLHDAFYTPLPTPYNLGTYVWGYKIEENPIGASPVVRGPWYPAHTIEAIRGTATTVSYFNNLGTDSPPWPTLQKYLTVDQTLHWADPLVAHPLMTPYTGPVPAVVHLHGGEVWSGFDGHPEAWWTPGAEGIGPLPAGSYRGSAYSTNIYNYPNQQEAATLWFHDHTLGITRLNVYAGLAGFYLLRDWAKEPVNLPGGPNDTGGSKYEVEIVIQDRMFDTNGQWYFPDLGINPTVHPFWIPEFVGDAIVVNGRTWPYLSVDGRRYRFRFLNGSNARFYRMWLENMVTATPGPVFWQIGTDGGLLDTPVKLDPMAPVMPRFFLLAPGERADVIIDFKGFEGQTLTLRNNARAPYPKGAAADPQTVGQIMQFRVNPTPVPTDPSLDPSTLPNLRALNPIERLVNPATGIANVIPDVKRQLTLNEVMGPLGPLEVLLNNTKWHGLDPSHPSYAPMVMETEMPRVGATEQWEIINLTADAHPIHLHLIQFQLLNRQSFNVTKYNKAYAATFPGGTVGGVTYPAGVYMPAYGPPLAYNANPNILGGNPDVTLYLQGPVRPPEPNEAGWKDTVIMYPGEVTRILARWAKLDATVGTTTPGVNTFPFVPTTGPGYVWHCHILDHEDNEMMRPYTVQP